MWRSSTTLRIAAGSIAAGSIGCDRQRQERSSSPATNHENKSRPRRYHKSGRKRFQHLGIRCPITTVTLSEGVVGTTPKNTGEVSAAKDVSDVSQRLARHWTVAVARRLGPHGTCLRLCLHGGLASSRIGDVDSRFGGGGQRGFTSYRLSHSGYRGACRPHEYQQRPVVVSGAKFESIRYRARHGPGHDNRRRHRLPRPRSIFARCPSFRKA